MAERRSARVVMQRQLEVERDEAPAPAAPAPEAPPAPLAAAARPPDEPLPPSNRGLLERQQRWHRERAKFESARATDEAAR